MTDQSTPIPPWAFPGNKVVCVNNDPSGNYVWETEPPKVGGVYTIHNVLPDDPPSLVLVEVKRGADAEKDWGQALGYGVHRFKPVATTDNEIEAQIYNRNSPRKSLSKKLTPA